MKTQINNIVKGNALTAGTKHEVRMAIAEKVFAENPDTLTMSYNLDGEEMNFTLNHRQSLSGKTQWYFGDMTVEQACRFVECEGAKKMLMNGKYEANVVIENDMTVVLCIYKRRGDGSWKEVGYKGRAMINKNVTIL